MILLLLRKSTTTTTTIYKYVFIDSAHLIKIILLLPFILYDLNNIIQILYLFIYLQ